MRRFSKFIPLVLLVSAVFPAFAADGPLGLSVRAAAQDGFVRFVFAGDTVPEVTVADVETGRLKIIFAKAVAVEGLEGAGQGLVPASKLTRESDTALLLQLEGAGIVRHRTLTLGNRLFVDVYPDNAAPVTQQIQQAEPVQDHAAKPKSTGVEPGIDPKLAPSVVIEDVVPEPKAEKKEIQAEASKKPATLPETPMEAPPVLAGAVPAPIPAEAAKPAAASVKRAFLGNAVVTIGSTQGLALAAFERQGYLWIVLSQENMNVPPQVSGPDAAALGPVDAVPIEGGSAYRLKLPEGAYVRPEGAGLVWRLHIEGRKTVLKTSTVDRDFSDTAEGPKVHISMTTADSVLRLPDPEIGDDLAVVTVGRADARLHVSEKYVDFDVIPAYVGVVIRPKADGMRVAVLPTEVTIGRAGGLRVSAAGPRGGASGVATEMADQSAPKKDDSKNKVVGRIMHLSDWALGGPKQYLESRRMLDNRVATAEESQKITEFIAAAKFMLGQGLPHEGIGYTNMALSLMPLLRDASDFQSLRGALFALSGQTDDALAALSAPGLEDKDEIKLWKAFVLAQQGLVTDAQKLMPPAAMSKALVGGYPYRVQAMMLPTIIEAVLARGDVTLATSFIDMYEKAADPVSNPDSPNAVAFFRGRAALLRGDNEAATTAFREASDGYIGPYPVKATLALVERGLSAKTIAREDAVAKLERFRYAWRGDTLETDMLQRLGLIYVTGGEQRRGLTILRDAATMAPDDATREKLVAVMQKAFKELFSGKTREKMTPLEAAAVATEFAELMPSAGEGEEITLNIAERMMAIDLLDRAADLVEPMVERTESAQSAMKYAQRAAAIRITDDRPEDALKIIDKALSREDVQAMATLDPKDTKAFALLRAKAKDQQKRTDEAFVEMASIPEDNEVLRLKADIAWGAQKWMLAADAMGKLVKGMNINATRPPTREQAQLILNLALALNLSGEADAIDTLRLTHGDIMRRTDLYQPFQLVTRTAREAKLADRTTLLKLVSEVNMFRDVLDTYKDEKNTSKPQKTAEKPVSDGQTDQSSQQKALEPGQVEPAKEEKKG
ncbi:MAG: hypothetical protein EBQ96_03330 [Proteobacteria bacterium]|nr:hypothetical protein [Pseudomonadota bacterium]